MKRLLHDVRYNIYSYMVRNDYSEHNMIDQHRPDEPNLLPITSTLPQLRHEALDRLHNPNILTSATSEYTSVIGGVTSPATTGRHHATQRRLLVGKLRTPRRSPPGCSSGLKGLWVVNKEGEEGDGKNRSVCWESYKGSAKALVGLSKTSTVTPLARRLGIQHSRTSVIAGGGAMRVLGTFPFSGGPRGQTD
ncbi:hypothetical protein LTR94_003957 [Friedmanniomyces endolithicus]|nr:hypothetical protein LTR94_003957 [Friedmanniomyces endolithicus]